MLIFFHFFHCTSHCLVYNLFETRFFHYVLADVSQHLEDITEWELLFVTTFQITIGMYKFSVKHIPSDDSNIFFLCFQCFLQFPGQLVEILTVISCYYAASLLIEKNQCVECSAMWNWNKITLELSLLHSKMCQY